MRTIYDVFNRIEADTAGYTPQDMTLTDIETKRYKDNFLKQAKKQKKHYVLQKATIAAAIALVFGTTAGTMYAAESGVGAEFLEKIFSGAYTTYLDRTMVTTQANETLTVKTNAPTDTYHFDIVKAVKNPHCLSYAILVTVSDEAMKKGYTSVGVFDCSVDVVADSNAMSFYYPDQPEMESKNLADNQFLIMGDCTFVEETTDDEICFNIESGKYKWKVTFPVMHADKHVTYPINQTYHMYDCDRQILSIDMYSSMLVINYGEIVTPYPEDWNYVPDMHEYQDTNFMIFADGSKVAFTDLMVGGSYFGGFESYNFYDVLNIQQVVALEFDGVRIDLK